MTEATARLADAGIPLGSQTVLLKGINDDVDVMKPLMQGLLKRRVKPYYLYQCDPIRGSGHFRTTVEKGLEIIEALRGHTTGYATPIFAVDAPGGGGKIQLAPDFVVGRDGDDLLLRNFEGKVYRYPDPGGTLGADKPPPSRAGDASMRIGVTYDLRADYLALGYSEEETAEFDSEITIDAICDALAALGYDAGPHRQCQARWPKRWPRGERWDAVFNFCEGLKGVAREAQVPALLDAYDIPYVFSDPLTLALTLDKAMTKRVVRDSGVPTADFARDREDRRCRRRSICRFRCSSSRSPKARARASTRNRKVDDTRGAATRRRANLLRASSQPVLVETFLPGREFTVGITGTGDEARGARRQRDRAERRIMSATATASRTRKTGKTSVDDRAAPTTAEAQGARARWRWRPGARCAAATAAASTSAATRRAVRTSSRSIRSRACAPNIPTSASSRA